MVQNDSKENEENKKQLETSAKITAFSMGNYQCIFDFTKCFEICKKRHEFYSPDKAPPDDFPLKFYILQDAENKIKMFQTYLQNLISTEAYFYVIFPNTMFMDIQDLFINIFRRMEGILDLSSRFNDHKFSCRIEELNLAQEKKDELQKLTTIRNKLIHSYGYARPLSEEDSKLFTLLNEGIRKIQFNSDPQKKLIDEDDLVNIGQWVTLIEILLDIILNIK